LLGDDRVRGTHEQMLLMQVVMVRLSRGDIMGFYVYVFYLLLEISCKGSWPIFTELAVLYLWMF